MTMNDNNHQADSYTDVYSRFSSLIDSDIPEEYKRILKNFAQQGSFYSQLLQSIKTNSDLSSFWNLPNTLGFDKTAYSTKDSFSALFDVNGFAAQSKNKLETEFASFLNQFSYDSQQELQAFQTALTTMSEFHAQISQTAMSEFNQYKSTGKQHTDEQLQRYWLRAGETAFKTISQQPQYIGTQATLFESLGKLQATKEQFTEHFSTLLGLPSRHELDELKQALHALRLEFADFREHTEAQLYALKSKPKKRR
ncbi:MAG: hypothetical protein COB62_04110 [Piscirickettsiaceae bacterium]|nr:MAG: hypothetical protein COB62_04110 [Piscirickettsiaceae bacterium]